MRVNGWSRSRRRRGRPFGPNLSRPDPGNPPMNSPKLSRTSLFSGLFLRTFTAIILFALLAMLSGCGGKLVKETSAEPVVERPPLPPVNFPTWFGNPARNFYGTGPWSYKPLEVVWDFKTDWSSGRLHKDPWAGTVNRPLLAIEFILVRQARASTP